MKRAAKTMIMGSLPLGLLGSVIQTGCAPTPRSGLEPVSASVAVAQIPPKQRRTPQTWNSGRGLSTHATPEAVAASNRLWQPAREAHVKGLSLLEKGDPKGAEALAYRCIALTPKGDRPMGAAYLLISDAHMESGDYEGALAHYKTGSATI